MLSAFIDAATPCCRVFDAISADAGLPTCLSPLLPLFRATLLIYADVFRHYAADAYAADATPIADTLRRFRPRC